MSRRSGRVAAAAPSPSATKKGHNSVAKTTPTPSRGRQTQLRVTRQKRPETKEEGEEEEEEGEDEEEEEQKEETDTDPFAHPYASQSTRALPSSTATSAPSRSPVKPSPSPSPRKVTKRGPPSAASAGDEERLLEVVDLVQQWMPNSPKDVLLKALHKASDFLLNYRTSVNSASPSNAEIPPQHKPLLKSIAKALVQKSILSSKVEEAIFQCFEGELSGLTRSSVLFDKAFYLIESLSIVQSPVVLCSLPSQTPAIRFIQALLNLLVHPFQSSRVEYYVQDILTGMLTEISIDELSMELVDTLLSYLTPQQLQTNPRAAVVVVRLIEKHSDLLERAICRWVQDVVIRPAKEAKKKKGGKGKGKKAEESDSDEAPREDIEEERVETSITNRSDQLFVFKELHLEVPGILTSLHGELIDLLTGVGEPARIQFSGVYCDIFTTKPSVIRQMLVIYENLLLRFIDVSLSVRLVMAEHVEQLLVKIYGIPHSTSVVNADDDDEELQQQRAEKADGVTSGVNLGVLPHSEQTSLEAVQGHMEVSLQDKEDAIRQKTVHGLSRAICHSASLVNFRLLKLMGQRCSDKRHEVRKEAIISLADMFHHYLTPYWRKGTVVPASHRKFDFVPRVLLSSCGADISNSLFVEMAMDTSLIGAKKDEVDAVDQRTNCLLAIFSTLDEQSKREVETHIGLPILLQYKEVDTSKALFINRFVVGKSSLQKAVQDGILIQQQIVSASQRGEDVSHLQRIRFARISALASRLLFEGDSHHFTSAGGSAAAAREEALRYITEVLLGLFAHEDIKVVEHLQTLSDCRAPLRDIRQAHEGLVKLVDKKGVKVAGKKKEKGPTATHIANRLACFCSQAVIPIDAVPYLFAAAQGTSAHLSTAALDLLLAMADSWPLMLSAYADRLYALLQLQGEEEKVIGALRMLSLIDFSNANIKHSLSTKLESTLKDLAMNGSVEVVRYAIRAIRALFTEHTGGHVILVNKLKLNVDLGDDVREDRSDALLHSLFQHYLDRLRLTEPKLESVLVGLGEVSAYYPRLFNLHRDAIAKFLFRELFLSSAAVYHVATLRAIEALTAFLESLAMTENVEMTTAVGKKFLSFYLRTIVNKGVINSTAAYSGPSTPSSEARAKAALDSTDGDEDLVMADEGEESNGEDALISEKTERQRRLGEVLLTVSKCLLDLCTHIIYHRFLCHVPSSSSVSAPSMLRKSYHFGNLAYVALCPDDRVRLPFLDHVITHLQASRLSFLYSAILCLAVELNDEHVEFQQKIRVLLTTLIRRTRSRVMAAEAYREQRSGSSASTPKGEQQSGGDVRGGGGRKSVINPSLPENVLADLIYLLSYHSAFVDPLDTLLPHQVTESILQSTLHMYHHFLAILDFFLDCVTADKHEGSNYSLLLAICSTIKNCEDVRDPSNTNIYKLADLVQLSVHKRAQHKEWKNSISSIVSLPSSLYRPRETPPKERYLPKEFRLPETKAEREKGGGSGGPSTPKKRKGGETGQTPQSRGGKTPASVGRENKAKVEKEVPTPSRQMPSRLVKSLISTYDESMKGEEKDEPEDFVAVRQTPRRAPQTPRGVASARSPPSGNRNGKENEVAGANGGERVMALGKGGKLEARQVQVRKEETKEMDLEEEQEDEPMAEEEEEGGEEGKEEQQEEEDAEEEEEVEEGVHSTPVKSSQTNGRAAAAARRRSSPPAPAPRETRASRR